MAVDRQEALDEGRFRALVEHAPDLVAVLNARAEFAYIAPSVQHLLGRSPGELLGVSLFDLTHPDDVDTALAGFQALVTQPGPGAPVEVRLHHADGSWRYVEALGYGALAVPGIEGVLLNARDISDRKRLEMQLAYQAFHDSLTGLPNRTVFMDRLSHALAWSGRRGDPVAVLFMDLDRFKSINDTLGHDAGDHLLIVVADRVRDCLRDGDTIARLGGDEFTVLLEGISGAGQAIEVAERIATAVSRPIAIGRQLVTTGASIGIALSEPFVTPEELMRRSDAALYYVKASGRGHCQLFDSAAHAQALARGELEGALRGAIERAEIQLAYQPAVDLRTGRITGLEAQPRWSQGLQGVIASSELLQLSQEHGLGQPLMRVVLQRACRTARRWRSRHQTPPVSVNVPAPIAHQPGFVDLVSDVLAESRLEPQALRLEITESAAVEERDRVEAALMQLAGLGVRLAIDDFGVGQSSLAALKHLPIDLLLIDQSFVSGLADVENVAIVRAIVILARTLQLQIAAEGISSERELSQARVLGCDLGRGDYLSPPVPPVAVPRLLRAGALALPV